MNRPTGSGFETKISRMTRLHAAKSIAESDDDDVWETGEAPS